MSTDPLPTSQKERLAESLRLSRRHHVLNELLRITTSTVEISEVFDRVGEQVQQLVDHDRLSIALHWPGEDYVEVYASLAEGRPQIYEQGARLPLHEVPQGEVILTGRPVYRRNLPEDGVYPLETVVARDAGLRSAMLIPLESRNHVFGSLNFGSHRPNRYSESDLEVAQERIQHVEEVLGAVGKLEVVRLQGVLQERDRPALFEQADLCRLTSVPGLVSEFYDELGEARGLLEARLARALGGDFRRQESRGHEESHRYEEQGAGSSVPSRDEAADVPSGRGQGSGARVVKHRLDRLRETRPTEAAFRSVGYLADYTR